MKLVSSRQLLSVVAALAGLSTLELAAQAPAGGRAGRGAAAGPQVEPLSILQQLAVAQAAAVPAELTAAQATALTALQAAPYAAPANRQNLQQLSQNLAQAELNLALARVAALDKANAALKKISGPQAAAAFGGAGGGRGGRGGGGGSAADQAKANFENSDGFVALFDGKTLNGWNGESNVWSLTPAPDTVGGAMSIHSDNVNRSTGQHHIHFVGRPGIDPIVKDFDLKVEFYIEGGNAGIHYRSRLLHVSHGANRAIADPATIANPFGTPLAAGITTLEQAAAAGITGQPWQISGYQLDITGANTASLYEGQGRGVVANAGEAIFLYSGAASSRTVFAQTSDIPYAQYGRPDGWNEAQVIARGNVLIHVLNGRVFTIGIDDDPVRRALSGIISLQLEGTGKVWYRSVRLKRL